ncbi:hypothetical protein Amal_02267 [Acetobacter malorum]|uniref:Uncharacterized protein n=1 Tax=Acetobacter malorum TaxID=178901 RepID=A0A177G8A3_9PROT|nr:hypothetical protein Amal_02267 [Acetobacter malorum]
MLLPPLPRLATKTLCYAAFSILRLYASVWQAFFPASLFYAVLTARHPETPL